MSFSYPLPSLPLSASPGIEAFEKCLQAQLGEQVLLIESLIISGIAFIVSLITTSIIQRHVAHEFCCSCYGDCCTAESCCDVYCCVGSPLASSSFAPQWVNRQFKKNFIIHKLSDALLGGHGFF